MATLYQLIEKAIAFDHGDAKRIQHFLKVYTYADLISHLEHIPPSTHTTLITAAVLHDIGIHAAEKKYGSTSGIYQEQEGPAPARDILTSLGYPEDVIERVCFLIAHHHTYHDVDGLDYHILLEADFLVNAYEDQLSKDAIRQFCQRVFRTASGIQLLKETFDISYKEVDSL